MANAQSTPTPSTWRDRYPPHPCADVYPMMTDAEIDALATDIKANGLCEPIVFKTVNEQRYVLDGRNRLEALARLGVTIDPDAEACCFPDGEPLRCLNGTFNSPFVYFEPENAAAYVISANIRRRHLTKAEQAELIVRTLDAATAADRANVARSVKRASNGQLHGREKDPLLTAAVAEGKKHGISKRTVQNARANVHGKKSSRATARPTSEAHPLAPPPPSTYEWVDAKQTEYSKRLNAAIDEIKAIIAGYTELDVTQPKLSTAERRTVRQRLVAARRHLDRAIVHFGGAHTADPMIETPGQRDCEAANTERRSQ